VQYRDAVVTSLVRAVERFGYRIGAGSPGLGPLFRALRAAGRDDVLYRLVTNPASPGYAYLVNKGATALEESLDGTGASKNHHFLGQVASWFVHGLAGIEQALGSTGYRRLVIKPALVGELAHAGSTYTTPQGIAASRWQRAADGLLNKLEVTVPPNTTARVYVPAAVASETFAASSPDARHVGYQDGAQVYDVGPGQTTFVHATSAYSSVGGTVQRRRR
jgi:alpha-L-rhamnosidase